MYESLLASNRRALGRASFPLAALALLGACDSDRPLEPTPAASVPTTAQPFISAATTGSIEWIAYQLQAGQKVVASGSKYRVTGYRMSIDVTDNGPNDANPMLGHYKASGLAPGGYQVCQTSVPFGFALSTPACHQLTVAASKTTTDEFVYMTAPVIMLEMRDLLGTRIGGGSVIVKDSVGNVIITAKDNYWPELDATAGVFKLYLSGPGKFTMCPANPPAGYSFWAQGLNICKSFNFKNGTTTQLGTTEVFPLPSVYWQVTDGTFGINGYVLIGPGAYTVSIPNESFSITVVDNNMNDMHPAVGKVFVKLPKAATYQICEVRAPSGHQPAQPTCRLVDVTGTEVVVAPWFINPPKP